MKTIIISIVFLFLSSFVFSQEEKTESKEETAAIVPASEQGTNLELAAVLNLFKDSKDLEDFENKLNDKEIGVSNLDLNNDSIIDYLRVVEKSDDNYRVIIIQAVLGENQFQDVATINAEKVSDKEVKVQVQGDEELYGENYYVEPEPAVYVNVYVWPIWGVMYAPTYVYYSSPYYWHYYPSYWHPYRPVPYTSYNSRTVVVTNRGVYVHTNHVIVHRPPVYHRTHSTVVVVRPNPHHHSYHGNPNNNHNNSGRNDYNRTNNNSNTRNNNSGNNSSNTRQNNPSNNRQTTPSNSRENNSSTRPSNSTQPSRGSSTQQKSNSSTQPSRGSSSQQRSSGSTQQRKPQQRSSGGRSGGGRAGGRR